METDFPNQDPCIILWEINKNTEKRPAYVEMYESEKEFLDPSLYPDHIKS